MAGGGRHSVTITGLQPGKSYKFAIVSYNGDKKTKATVVSVKTKTYTAPTDFKVKSTTSKSVTLSWKASKFSETVRYEVVCKDAKGKTMSNVQIVYNGRTATISGLKSSTIYKFEIRAVSDMLGGLKSKVAKTSVTTKRA
jgi:hypothetical protein